MRACASILAGFAQWARNTAGRIYEGTNILSRDGSNIGLTEKFSNVGSSNGLLLFTLAIVPPSRPFVRLPAQRREEEGGGGKGGREQSSFLPRSLAPSCSVGRSVGRGGLNVPARSKTSELEAQRKGRSGEKQAWLRSSWIRKFIRQIAHDEDSLRVA